MSQKIVTSKIKVSQGSYSVHSGQGALSHLPEWLKQFPSKRAFIVADRNLTIAREVLKKTLHEAGWECEEIPVEAGESFKNFDSLLAVYGHLLQGHANRDSVLFALGGGSIGDAAGFVAATYLRGIAWVGIPTSLLAQVDSSIGGKTAVNHPMGKNLIGAFHQPSLVVCDIDLLKTLSQREIVSGLGEAIKYGIIYDKKFFHWLRDNWSQALSLNPDVMTHIVGTSVSWKAKVVSRDEFDRTGEREVLNFGHTFGHALESVTHYETYQHGEAILWGMRFGLALSLVRNHLSQANFDEIDGFLRKIPVPALPSLHADDLFKPMVHDKKVKNGKLHFVLIKDLGKASSDKEVTSDDLTKALGLIRGATP